VQQGFVGCGVAMYGAAWQGAAWLCG